MRRKIIELGNNSTVMTLPVKWIRERDLKKGDEINVEETAGNLVVSTEKQKKQEEIHIDLTKASKEDIRTIVSAIYRRGVDEVVLTSKEDFSFEDINHVVDTLTGYVITEESDKKIVIKNTIREDFEDLTSLINKLFITVHYFNETVIKSLQTKKPDFVKLAQLKRSIMRLRDYCQRMIHLNGYGGNKSPEYYILIFLVHDIASDYHIISRNKRSLKNKVLLAELKEYNGYLSQLNHVLSSRDFKTGLKLNGDLRKVMLKSHDKDVLLSLPVIEDLFTLSSRILGIIS